MLLYGHVVGLQMVTFKYKKMQLPHMPLMQIRLSKKTVDEMRKIGEELFGESTTDDKTAWTLIMEYRKSEAEKEILRMKLEECEKLKGEK